MKRCACFLLVLAGCAQAATPVQQADVLASYPHDSAAFTQGLVIHDGKLYEGTGRNGESSLREVALDSGEVLRRQNLPQRYFGEGITVLGDKVYQLTWQSHIGFVYSLADFKQLTSFFLPGEGWGITDDGTQLIVSDGTATLRFLDPATLKETHRVAVTDDGVPLDRLNELEYIDGEVWANVWYTDYIARIDPATGQVKA
jgi:glutamine cyclotransferase